MVRPNYQIAKREAVEAALLADEMLAGVITTSKIVLSITEHD
jgi:hypothetical protein